MNLKLKLLVCVVSCLVQVSYQKDEICDMKTHYRCSDGSKCIPKDYICNGNNDCDNGDDEVDCDKKRCKGDLWYECRDGSCISHELTCDHEAHCPDASDESDEMCEGKYKTHAKCDPDTQFECLPEECIPKKYVCDGRRNCLNGRDEEPDLCKKMNITCTGFMCKDGKKCLPSITWACDGVADCEDASDEDHCHNDCKPEDGKFQCSDEKECIPLSKTCDGKKDCEDGSDEEKNCNNSNGCKDITCDGECKVLPSGPTCICKKGFTFNTEKKKCEDVNECEVYGTCSQGCINTDGSYYCTCANGFQLKSDNMTCIARGSDAILVYTTPKHIRTIHLRARFVEQILKTKQGVGISYDGKSYFWTDVTEGKESILKWTPDETKKIQSLLTAGLENPEDLAVDWLTGNIYFTDANLTHIGVCTENGLHCTQLVATEAMDKPRAIALHPTESLLFWTDWGQNPHIGVSFMDGSDAKVLVSNLSWPNGIALDWPNGRIYWTDAKLRTIESATIAGKDRRIVIQDIVMHPFGIAVFEDKLYWSDWDTMNIESCNKFTGKDFEPLVQGEYVYDVHIYHESMMPKQNHACINSKCTHMCLLGPNRSFSCACPEGMELVGNFACEKTKKTESIILGVGKHIAAVTHQTFGRHTATDAQELENFVEIMEFNSLNGQLFVAESKLGKIVSVDLKNNAETVVVSQHILNVKAMGFDYLANNLYWVDDVKSTIEVISLNNKKRTIVLHFSKSDNPIALALIPSLGEMFVAFQTKGHIHIDRQSMKGGHDHFHVIESGLSQSGLIDIVVDEEKNLVYWSDSDKKIIEFSNYDGSNIQNFVRTKDRKPAQMALIGGEIYWTSLGSKTLQWRNATGAGGVKMVTLDKPPGLVKMPNLIAITAGVPLRTQNHPCMVKNGGCSDICVSIGPEKRACLCEMGHYFKHDSNQTVCIKRNECGFMCAQSLECLESKQRCDGVPDCLDGSDEKDCKPSEAIVKCGSTHFMCKDGQCIPQEKRCEGHFDCRDRSDESDCSPIEKEEHCRSNQLRCPSGHCLDVTLRCDGTNDCGDNYDEREDICLSDCPDNFFKCASGQCIPKEFECNSFVDCKDISDEHEDCPIQMCKAEERVCPNGWCIDKKLFCDGFPDCQDGFDEIGCDNEALSNSTCDLDEFSCVNDTSKCYTIGMKCDGKADCPMGDDEINCPNCPPNQFECRNGLCITKRYICDGFNDCMDNSDEESCDKNNSDSEPKFDETCASDEYKCSDGTCLEYSKVCDKKKHCSDDEDSGSSTKCLTACDNKPCSGPCLPTPKGAVCSCEDGFKLKNGKDCEDIDECATLSPCSQKCDNSNGSFVCSCYDGFILSDKTSCKALGEPKTFLFAVNDQIRKFTDFPKSISVVDIEKFPIADIDINVNRKKIVYALMGSNELIEMDIEDKTNKTSFDKVPLVSKIAHDWITGNTYVVHYGDDMRVKILVCSMKTKSCAPIHSLDYHEFITAIRIDPINKFVFFAKMMDSSLLVPSSKIVRMRLDGSDPQNIANETMIKSLAIDVEQQRVYYTETITQTLFKMDYSGKNSRSLIAFSKIIKRPIAMALFENHAFILQQASQMVARCKLYGNMECHEFEILGNSARQLVIGHSSNQKMTANICENNSCEFVCIPTDLGYKCLDTNGTAVEPLSIKQTLMAKTPETMGGESSGFWIWTFIIFILVSASTAAVFLMYRRRGVHGRFNVSMYFRKNEMGKSLPREIKPTPFPRTITGDTSPVTTPPSVNTLNKNCHEFVNDEHHSIRQMTAINLGSTDVSGFSDETDEMDHDDFSNDPHQRLIL